MITTLIFDLNKVLVTYEEKDVSQRYLDEVGIDEKEFWKAGMKHFNSYNCGLVSIEEFFLTIMDELELDHKYLKPLLSIHEEQFTVVEGMVDILKSVKGRYKLILLAGDGFESFDFKTGMENLKSYFDSTYATCYEKMNKRNPEIYRRVLDGEELEGEECLFIDDIQEHLDVAISVGIKTILFTDVNELKKSFDNLKIEY